jgi:flagellar biosynthetic protein FliR
MLNWSVQETLVFTLLIFRTAGLMMITPFFGSTAIPIRIRIMFSVVLSFAIMSVVPRTFVDEQVVYGWDLGDYFLNVLAEMSVGAAMGLICLTMFSAIIYAGKLMDQSIGFTKEEMINPFTQQRGSLTGQFQFYIFMILFLLMNGHLYFLEVYFESVSRVPLGYVSIGEGFIALFARVMSGAFELTFRLAAPVMLLCFLINMALGFISKAVPSMNVFILGFPIKIMMGLGLLMIVAGQVLNYGPALTKSMIETEHEVLEALRQDG